MVDYKSLGVIALIFLVVGVVLAIGSNISQEVQESLPDYSTITNGYDAWTGATNATTKNLSQDRISNVVVTNITGNIILAAANYTLDTGAGTIILTDISNGWNGTDLNVTYNYETEGTSYAAAGNATLALGNMSKWLPLLALLMALVMVIGTIGMVRLKR